MNREDVIRMAREAGLFVHKEVQPEIERFAALVAAAEREEIADDLEHGYMDDEGHHIQYAAVIRAKSKQ